VAKFVKEKAGDEAKEKQKDREWDPKVLMGTPRSDN
jgi:hypothetical protein